MIGDELTDEAWARIEPFVPGGREGKRGPRSDNRRFVNALIFTAVRLPVAGSSGVVRQL